MNDDYEAPDYVPLPESLELTPRPHRKSGPVQSLNDDDAIDATIRAKEATERRLIAENMVMRANLAVLLARVAEADATIAAMESRVDAAMKRFASQKQEGDQVIGRMRAYLATAVKARKASKNGSES